MVKFNRVSQAVLAISSFSALSNAHPEHHEMEHALKKRDEHAAHIQRGLDNCASHPKFLALKERAQNRRWEKAQKMRKARGIDSKTPYKTKRDLAALEAFEDVNHNMTSLGYTESTAASTLFSSYKNVSCILTPEVTQGPYYVTGEYIRTDVTEDQEGVPVHLEYQYIDVSTCDAATGLYLETWQANATGVYSGVIASGNGNDADETNLDKTFLRGVTAVDSDGVAYFDTIFVGHYADRASHIHIITHEGGTEETNGTFSGGTIAHVGQIFFDESLKDVVEATAPYNTNTQAITSNDEDMWAPDQADNSYDPLPDWAYLGDDVSDGLLMWISIGIDTSADYTVSAAAHLTADGGVENSDSADGPSTGDSSSSMGGQGGGFTASGSGSAGSAPTGTAGGDQGGSFTGGSDGPPSSATSSSVSSSLSSSSSSSSSSSLSKASSSSFSSSSSSSSSFFSSSSSSSSSSVKVSPSSSSVKASSSSSSIKASSSSSSIKASSSSSSIKASSSAIKAPSSSSSSPSSSKKSSLSAVEVSAIAASATSKKSSSSEISSSSTHPSSSLSSVKSFSTSSTKTSAKAPEKPTSSSSNHETSTTPVKSSSSTKKSSTTIAKTSSSLKAEGVSIKKSSSTSSHKKHHTKSKKQSSSTSSTKKSLTTLTTSGKKTTSKA